MKKLTLFLGALLIAGASFACDGDKKDSKKACCKKEEKAACCKKGGKSCDKSAKLEKSDKADAKVSDKKVEKAPQKS